MTRSTNFYFFISFSVLATAAGDILLGVSDFQCPQGHTIYPHPQCELYYTCYGGQTTNLWQCRDNLLFDLAYNGCNWPEQTNCGNRTRPAEASPTVAPSTPSPFSCPDDGFYTAYPHQCNREFFTCLDGYGYPTNCPAHGVFEPSTRRCVSPNSPACKVNGTAPAASSTVPAARTTVPAARTTVPVAPTTTIARNGTQLHTSTILTTPWAASATSGAPSVPVATTIVVAATTTTRLPRTTSDGNAFICAEIDGNYPDPMSCTCYYTCHSGQAYKFACPAGLVYNPIAKVCDWPANVPGC